MLEYLSKFVCFIGCTSFVVLKFVHIRISEVREDFFLFELSLCPRQFCLSSASSCDEKYLALVFCCVLRSPPLSLFLTPWGFFTFFCVLLQIFAKRLSTCTCFNLNGHFLLFSVWRRGLVEIAVYRLAILHFFGLSFDIIVRLPWWSAEGLPCNDLACSRHE